MSERNVHSELGQTLILFAVALIVLIGFVALAIDGGTVYSDRRFDQNAADASALAGAISIGTYFHSQAANIPSDMKAGDYYNCASTLSNSILWSDVRLAGEQGAITRAGSNTFNIDEAAHPGVDGYVSVECVEQDSIHFPRVHVKITRPVNTSLIQLFYRGPVVNTVEAVADVYPPTDFGGGNGIASLSPNCQKNDSHLVDRGGVFYDGGGSNEIRLYNGGIYSNSCIDASGGVTANVLDGTPPGGSIAGSGAIQYAGIPVNNPQCIDGGGNNICFNPDPVHNPDKLPTIPYDIPQACYDHNYDRGTWNGGTSVTLQPGNYYTSNNGTKAIEVKNNDKVVMAPGLYCLFGDFYGGGGEITTENYSLTRDGVTIIMVQGSFVINGNVHTTISAPNQGSTNLVRAIPGLLLYVPPSNSSQVVNMGGSSGSIFTGTVYVPSGSIDIGGNQSTESVYNTQLVGYVIVVHGNVNINITYDSRVIALATPRITLAK